jgi:hypothetical protein
MTVGGVLVVGGLIVSVAGIVLANSCGGEDQKSCTQSQNNLAIGVMFGGLGAVALGIPLFFVGRHKVRVYTTSPSVSSLSTSLPAWVGEPAGRGWRWKF